MDPLAARIALQLYTVRDACDRDLPGTLGEIADQGYAAVELFSLHGESAEAWRALLDQLGLVACGRHVRLEQLEAEHDVVVREARVLGLPRVVVPMVTPPTTIAEADHVVARLERAAARLAADGVALGYHNHDWEFAPLSDGATAYARFVAADRALVFLELDLGWAWQAGEDPAHLLGEHAGRCPLVHVKDQTARGGRSCPVGTGAVPYAEILAGAGAAGVEWLIVEQEDFDADGSLAAARRSAEGLRRLLGADPS